MWRAAPDFVVKALLLPAVVGVAVYYGFGTNYTGRVFHEEGFRAQYESGIYRYRVLGRWLLIATHRFVSGDHLPARALQRYFGHPPASARVLDEAVVPSFYLAYFVLNTSFLVLAAALLYLILDGGPAMGPPNAGIYLSGVLLMGLTQYVVTPYDTLSYAQLLLAALLILRPFAGSFPLLVTVVVLATLTRESAALILSFYFVHERRAIRSFDPKAIGRLAILVAAFLLTYGVLRLLLGTDHGLYQGLTLRANLTQLKARASKTLAIS